MATVGYAQRLRRRNYAYADFFAGQLTTRIVELAAFAREPCSYDTACIAAACANEQQGGELVSRLRALGAPLAFEILPDGSIVRWQVTGQATPRGLESIPASHIRQAFWRHRAEWGPQSVLRAKSIPLSPHARQLDFFDIGLMRAIGETVNAKLSELMEDVVARGAAACKESGYGLTARTYARLFALVFRFVAAKVLGDRGQPGDWLVEDAREVIEHVDDYYFRSRPGPPALADQYVQSVVWEQIRKAFHFENVSADALAYVYDNALVTPQARKALGTHSTPPEIAEYLVRHLPFEDQSLGQLHVLEPCSGHGVFLVAAMRRMRELLEQGTSAKERHEFFVRRLTGIEVDAFACEVARLSLMLADYPNPDGWDIIGDDVFAGDAIARHMRERSVVLCNPPFENFSPQERKRYANTIAHVAKPAEVLSRVLRAGPPAMLGFVLPRTFLTGRAFRPLHETIGRAYEHVELVGLPDSIFRHSSADAALVLAWERKTTGSGQCVAVSSLVYEADRRKFLTEGKVSCRRVDRLSPGARTLWTSPLQELWDRLEGLPTLGDVVEIHRGIEFCLPLDEAHRHRLISDEPRPGFVKGLHTVREHLDEALVLKKPVWLNTSEDVMRGNAHQRAWHEPKAILNAATVSRGPWRLICGVDTWGLTCYQNFHGIWPTGSWPINALAAVLNAPVANAYVRDREGKRHNRRVTLRAVPLPRFDGTELERLEAVVSEYLRLRRPGEPADGANQRAGQLRTCLRRIDALVLEGYDLPPRLERKLLDQFTGHQRPVPFRFDGFFPRDFTACIPYHEYVSESFRRAEAQATLDRLEPIRDKSVHDAMEHLRWLGREDE